MSARSKPFQPGAVLCEVLVGACRASSSVCDAWREEPGTHKSAARVATCGQSGDDTGQARLKRRKRMTPRDAVLSDEARHGTRARCRRRGARAETVAV